MSGANMIGSNVGLKRKAASIQSSSPQAERSDSRDRSPSYSETLRDQVESLCEDIVEECNNQLESIDAMWWHTRCGPGFLDKLPSKYIVSRASDLVEKFNNVFLDMEYEEKEHLQVVTALANTIIAKIKEAHLRVMNELHQSLVSEIESGMRLSKEEFKELETLLRRFKSDRINEMEALVEKVQRKEGGS